MADDVDQLLERESFIEQARIRAAMKKADEMPKGEAGDCKMCGEYFARLVKGVCARCRDKNGLP